jgi:predicted amidohydrolase YtcJ
MDSTPDLIVLNASVHTVDPVRPSAEALAVYGELIGHVGTNADVERLAGPFTQVIDAGGRLALPGFNDAHVHLIRGAEEIVGVDLRPSKDEADLASRLRAHVAKLPKARWVTGGYWDHESWPGRSLPTRAQIDSVTPDHPVFVQRLDGHVGLANSVALELAGIGSDTQAPAGGAIVRDGDGQLTGVLKDTAMDLVTTAIPADSLDQTIEKARAALRHAASLGVTTVQDMTASANELRAYQKLRATGQLTARIYSIQNHDSAGLRAAGVTTGFGDDWLRIGGVKFFADGSMGAGTAAFFEPYTDDPGTTGLLIHTPDALQEAVFEADAAGFQPIVHAIGDRANALVLDIFERLQAVRGHRDRRPRIEHVQVVRAEDKARFRPLGVIASIQPSHCIDDMRWSEARIGRARSAVAYNVRSFVDAGARIAFGTDWFVEPLNPMLGLYASVTRQFPDGTPVSGWFPEERITLAEAVEYYTLGSAYAEFADRRKGSLTQGKLADLVILSHDIFTVPPREILETHAVLTMVGGKVVYNTMTESQAAHGTRVRVEHHR